MEGMTMRKGIVLAFLSCLMLVGSVCWAQNRAETKAEHSDEHFVFKASEDGMAEVDHGNLAAQRAQGREVKEFGQRMVTDHGKANSELLAIANRKQLKVAPDMGAKHRAMHQKLSGMSGEEFDRHYMKHMVEGHEEAVKLFQTQAKHGKDADLKQFAEKTLPVIQEHLKMAKSIQAHVGGKSTVNK